MTRPNNGQDDLDVVVGIRNGCLVAIPLWALLLWGAYAIWGCGK